MKYRVVGKGELCDAYKKADVGESRWQVTDRNAKG